MSKPTLALLPSSVGTLPSRLGYEAGNQAAESRYRSATDPAMGWYKTARWQRLRWSVLLLNAWRCAKCGRVCADKYEAVVDHVVPHRGDQHAFWHGELQVLCKPCHDSTKQREERCRDATSSRDERKLRERAG